MADGYGIGKLEDYIDSIRDNGAVFEIQNLSKEVQEILRDLTKLIDQTVKGDVPTQQELKELQKSFYSYIQSSQTTTKETRNYVSQMFSQLFVRMDKLDKNRLAHSFNANLSNMVRSGVLDVNKKSAEKNILAQLLKAGFVSPLTKSVETFQDKLMSFLNIEKSQEKTKRRQFTEDLVEGLSRSKFFGGALTDLIRLGTLFAASWLKDKGTWGKILAVALVTAGPAIGAAIAGFITKALIGGVARLGGFLVKGVFNTVKWFGGILWTWLGRILAAIGVGKLFGGAGRIGGKAATKGAAKVTSTAASVVRDSLILDATGKAFKIDQAGKVIQNAPKGTGSTGFLKGISNAMGKVAPWVARIGGFMGRLLPWVLRLSGAVGLIVLAIQGIWAVVNWWKGRKNKDGGVKSSSQDVGLTDVSNQSNNEVKTSTGSNSTSNATLAGRTITSGYGQRIHPVYGTSNFHTGVDLKYNKGDAINALMGGKVISAQWQQGFGNTVRVQDENGYVHVYGHLDSLGVKAGQEIKRGQYLGAAGMTGTATGVHLHYGVAKDASWARNSYVDPIAYLGAHEPEALKRVESRSKKDVKEDKFAQNVIDFWESKGKDKGSLRLTARGLTHSKSDDYKKLTDQFKEEYVRNVAKIDPFGYEGGTQSLKYAQDRAIALSSQEAIDYTNRRMAEYVGAKKTELAITSSTQSIGISQPKDPDTLPVTTKNASQQAQEQWNNINRDFKKDKEERLNQNEQSVVPPEKQPMIDFSGTETFSKVLQSAINIQQQSFQQR